MRLKIRTSYILGEFSLNMIFATAVFAFMFSMRALLKIFELYVRGTFSPFLVSKVFFLALASTFSIIIPLAFLYSSTAIFARMSMDRELLVLSSSGIPPLRMTGPLILLSSFTVLFLVMFNLYVLPAANYSQRQLIRALRFRNPLSLIQEKNVITEIPGITIFLGKIDRDFRIEDISITQTEDGRINFIRAGNGNLKYDRKENALIFSLRDGSLVSQYRKEEIATLNFDCYTFTYTLPESFIPRAAASKMSDRMLPELLSVGGFEETLEINKRIVYGVTPILFMFLGAAIGRRVRQKSKILHVGLGGATGLIFYQAVFAGEILARRFAFPPLVWSGAIVSGLSSFLLWRKKC